MSEQNASPLPLLPSIHFASEAEQGVTVQEVLNQLWEKQELPFKLRLGSLLNQGQSNYRVHFYDSRMRSVEFSCQPGESFQEVFRAAVLERVSRLSGPLVQAKKNSF
jgi:hypothetical protein